MLIVADENIPILEDFFGDLGEIRRYPGRSLSARETAGADLLLVRSVTRVDAALLGNHRPRFIGSATIGTDHVDTSFLAAAGIPFASAPGCNARAVAEYVATVLVLDTPDPAGQCLGLVGCGNVGRAVAALAAVLGWRVLACDPLLPADAWPSGVEPVSLDALLDAADVLSLHVPLTDAGPAPTRHLLGRSRLVGGRWRLLLNTSRGPVVDNAALQQLLREQSGRRAVLDVWEDEPRVPGALLARTWLGTPHIAGYSSEGKWRGTGQVYDAACAALGMAPRRTLDGILRARGDAPAELAWPGSLGKLLSTCCPILADDARLRSAATEHGDVPPAMFDRLRREYPERREFGHYRVRLPAAGGAQTTTPQVTAALLGKLGFLTCQPAGE